jgi:hypothetical protein
MKTMVPLTWGKFIAWAGKHKFSAIIYSILMGFVCSFVLKCVSMLTVTFHQCIYVKAALSGQVKEHKMVQVCMCR